MGRLNFIVIFFGCLAAFGSKAQTDSTIHLSEQQIIQGNFTNFYIDNLGNVYLLNTDNQIKKINDKGDSVAVANALKRFGDIYSMDVSNSLKVVVYYKDFTTIVVLDRFLKNVNTIDLRKYGILQARSVAISYDNNYWVFDEVENKLKKIDDYGNILLSTPDLRMVFDDSFLPEKIIDYDGYVYLYNKSKGCKIFDYYGALKQSLPLPGRDNIQVIKNSILGFSDSAIYVYNLSVFTEHKYLLDPEMKDALELQKLLNSLYVLKSDGLYMYAINN
ncbi:MAG TPA: hypothetical protein VFW07_04175 [Parafilimonas sp.]|nr:hypothetical protein [Parafilimonas sp.]